MPSDPDATRTALAGAASRFATAWRTGRTPPRLAEHLPAEPELRRTTLVELVKVDLHERRRRGVAPMSLADYRTEFPELDTDPLPPDLIYEDIHSRRAAGQQVDPGEYTADYATQLDQLGSRLDRGYRSTIVTDPDTDDELAALAPGDTIDDFALLAELGRGAFARVFLARQVSMQRLVAVKVSRDHSTESQTLAQLDDEHIVRVFDQRVLPGGGAAGEAGEGLKLLYMQYVPGGTLAEVIHRLRDVPVAERDGARFLATVDAALDDAGGLHVDGSPVVRAEIAGLTWSETVAWLGRRIALALDHAGEHGVMHRDVKPANVLITADGAPKLADFNISFSQDIPGASPVAYFGGSLYYMSPEQLAACHPSLPGTPADLDTRSDLFALAVLLWQLLTGSRPFADETAAGESATSVDRMIELRRRPIDPDRLAALPPDCPPALRRALLTCLSPDRERRYATGAEFARQLGMVLDRSARDLLDPPTRSIRSRVRMRPLPVVTLSSLLGLALAAYYLLSHNDRLLRELMLPEEKQRLTASGYVVLAVLVPLGLVVLLWWCWRVLLVPRGLRVGKVYDPVTLARARADTVACGDRIAVVVFAGWMIALAVLVVPILHSSRPVSGGVVANLVISHVVCGALAVAYSFFPATRFVMRWYYPVLLGQGHTGAGDAVRLVRLRRRSRVYLGIAGLVPLFGVASGLLFLDAAQRLSVIGSIVGLCLGGAFAYLAAQWAYYGLDTDLRTFERILAVR